MSEDEALKLQKEVEKYKAQANRTRSGIERILSALESEGKVNRDKALRRKRLGALESAYVYAIGTLGGDNLMKVLFPTRHFKAVMDEFLAQGYFSKSIYDKQIAKWEKQTFPDDDDDLMDEIDEGSPSPQEESAHADAEPVPLTLEQRKIVIYYDTKEKKLSRESTNDVRDAVYAIIDDIYRKSGRVPRTVTRKEDGVWQMVKTDKDIPSFGKWRITFKNETY